MNRSVKIALLTVAGAVCGFVFAWFALGCMIIGRLGEGSKIPNDPVWERARVVHTTGTAICSILGAVAGCSLAIRRKN